MPRTHKPITDHDRKRVRELHTQGLTRNAIARTIGRSMATVTKIATELGLNFDRTQTRKATEARQADLAALRAESAIKLHQTADRLLDQIFAPAKVYNFGGKDNTYAEEWHDEPPPADKRALMGAAGMAYDRSLKLAPTKDNADIEAARSMLTTLGQAITQRVEDTDTTNED